MQTLLRPGICGHTGRKIVDVTDVVVVQGESLYRAGRLSDDADLHVSFWSNLLATHQFGPPFPDQHCRGGFGHDEHIADVKFREVHAVQYRGELANQPDALHWRVRWACGLRPGLSENSTGFMLAETIGPR